MAGTGGHDAKRDDGTRRHPEAETGEDGTASLSAPTVIRSGTSFAGTRVTVESQVVEVAPESQLDIEYVRFSDIAVVVALLDDAVVMTRQYRYAAGTWLLEAPAGLVEPGEVAATAAIRELREETGYRCASLEELGELRVSPHLSNEITHVFLADGLRPGPTDLEPGEFMSVVRVAVADLRGYVARGLLVDAKTIAALVLAGVL
jgi:ADP-ribose pyrophosphatase